MIYVPSPSYFKGGRKKKDFRYGVLTYLWIIARDTEEIKEILQKENEPSDLVNAIERYNQEFIDDLMAYLARKKEKTDDKGTETESENK